MIDLNEEIKKARNYRGASNCGNCIHGRPMSYGSVECTQEEPSVHVWDQCVCDRHVFPTRDNPGKHRIVRMSAG